MVDLLRSCYSADVRFFTDSDRTIRIHWYFVDGPRLPFPTVYGSSNWVAENGEWVDILGEVSPGPRPYRKGNRPAIATFLGVPHYCGTPDQWANGCSIADAHYVGVADRDPCCPNAPPVGLVFGLKASMAPAVFLGVKLAQGFGAQLPGLGQPILTARLGWLATGWSLTGASAGLQGGLYWNTAPWADTLAPGALTALLSVLGGLHLVSPARGSFTALLGLRQALATTAAGLGVAPVALLWGLSAGGAYAQLGQLLASLGQREGLGVVPAGRGQGRPASGSAFGLGVVMKPAAVLAGITHKGFTLQVTMATQQEDAMPGTWTKYTLSYAGLTAGAGNQSFVLRNMAASEVLLAGLMEVSTTFQGGGSSQVTLGMGYSGGSGGAPADQTHYFAGVSIHDATVDPPQSMMQPDGGRTGSCRNIAAGWQITLLVVATGANVNQLTQGQLTIWLLTSQMP